MPSKKPRSKKQMIDQYKRSIWNAGGRLPDGIRDDKPDAQIAALSSRLKSLTGRNA